MRISEAGAALEASPEAAREKEHEDFQAVWHVPISLRYGAIAAFGAPVGSTLHACFMTRSGKMHSSMRPRSGARRVRRCVARARSHIPPIRDCHYKSSASFVVRVVCSAKVGLPHEVAAMGHGREVAAMGNGQGLAATRIRTSPLPCCPMVPQGLVAAWEGIRRRCDHQMGTQL